MLYLASQSPRRKTLLRHLGKSFRVVRSSHRETICSASSPSTNAMRNARGKAHGALLPPQAQGIVIGADTFLYFRGQIIGKPRTLQDARCMLSMLSGKSHWVYTGVCLLEISTGLERVGYAKTKVTFHPLSAATITRLLDRMAPLDKAGGYAIQHDGGELIASIQGSQSNVIGLPLELLRRKLAQVERAICRARSRRCHPRCGSQG